MPMLRRAGETSMNSQTLAVSWCICVHLYWYGQLVGHQPLVV